MSGDEIISVKEAMERYKINVKNRMEEARKAFYLGIIKYIKSQDGIEALVNEDFNKIERYINTNHNFYDNGFYEDDVINNFQT